MSEAAFVRKIIYPNGDGEELLLQQIGPDSFLLEESSALGHAYFHDSFRASPNEDGSLRFDYVVTRSGLCTNTWILSKALMEADELRAVLSDIVSFGGHWEQLFGGMLLTHLPVEAATMIQERITAISSKKRKV